MGEDQDFLEADTKLLDRIRGADHGLVASSLISERKFRSPCLHIPDVIAFRHQEPSISSASMLSQSKKSQRTKEFLSGIGGLDGTPRSYELPSSCLDVQSGK